MKRSLVAAVGAAVVFCGACTVRTSVVAEEARPLEVKVVRVIDGDTAVFRWPDGREFSVRFIGIDTPERRDPLGPAATAYTRSLLRPGAAVFATFDADTHDRYGRTLAYLYPRWPADDAEMINAQIVAAGWARPMTIPPNVAFSDLFVRLQREARTAKRGMWAIEPFGTPTT